MTDPFREVAHIQWMTGAKGGEFWVLTLECGHTATRAKRQVRASDIALPRPADPRRYSAPKRVQCWHCGNGAEQRPVVVPPELEGLPGAVDATKCEFVVSESIAAITTHLRAIGFTPPNYGGFGITPRPSALCHASIAWDTKIPIAMARCMACMLEAIKPGSAFATAHPEIVTIFEDTLKKRRRI